MLRMTLQTEKMIRKSLNIFHIRKPGAIRRAILGCVTGLDNLHKQKDYMNSNRAVTKLEQATFKCTSCISNEIVTGIINFTELP